MSPQRNVVVLGSNCVTGAHIVDALLDDRRNSVVGVSRSPQYQALYLPYARRQSPHFRFVQMDLVREPGKLMALLDEFKPQAIVNVAALSEVALSNQRPEEYFETNTMVVVRLCNQLRSRPYLQRYVQVSSAEIFGNCEAPKGEDALFNPSTPYAVSKAAADMYLQTLHKNFQFPVVITRSTNIYGRHQQLFKIIPRTVIYLKLGRILELHGGGRSMKSFVHVRDVARGVVQALDQGKPGRTYHFTVQSDRTIADVVGTICALMGRDFARSTQVVTERLGQDARYLLDCTNSQRDLGWEPTVAFEEGVREVVSWIEDNWRVVQKEPLEYVHKASPLLYA